MKTEENQPKIQNPKSKIAIALDVGGSSVKSVVVSAAGHVVGQPELTPVDSQADAETILETFAEAIRQHLPAVAEGYLLGIAVGMPGPFDYQAGICYITGVAKYESIYGLNIRDRLRELLNQPALPILFRNDAEAAIMGEALYGAGRPYCRLIGVTLGTGIGSAFIVDGDSVEEGPGVPPHGWLYQSPFLGRPADDLFSTRGLMARLGAIDPIYPTVADFAGAARRGEGRLRQEFAQFGADLGDFLTPFATDFGAEAILVLGGIARAFDLFGPLLQQHLPVPALEGELGTLAPLLGAADLLFKPAAA